MTANSPTLPHLAPLARRLRGWQVMLGSNAQHEFSGWQEGLDLLRADSGEDFDVILVNDTVCSHRRFALPRRAAFAGAVLGQPAGGLVGFTDGLAGGAPFTIAGLSFRRWVSSYLAFLSAEALARVDHRVWYRELNESCVPGGSDIRRFFSEAVSENLTSHLCRWLFERGWYRSEPLTELNAARFTLKARSIVNEMVLSIRAQHPVFGITDPFEQFPRLARWDRRFKTFRKSLAEFRAELPDTVANSSTVRDWRLR